MLTSSQKHVTKEDIDAFLTGIMFTVIIEAVAKKT